VAEKKGKKSCMSEPVDHKDKIGPLSAPAWEETDGMFKRHYSSYEEYVHHQGSKLKTIRGVEKQDRRYKEALKKAT
jgi:hypothetical protein